MLVLTALPQQLLFNVHFRREFPQKNEIRRVTQTEGFFPLEKNTIIFFSPEKRENPLKRDLRTQGTHCWILEDEWDWIILSELKFPITAGACFPSAHVTILGYGLYPEIYKKRKIFTKLYI